LQLPPNPGRSVNSPLLRTDLEEQEETTRADWLLRHSLAVLAGVVLLMLLVVVLLFLLT
jgi:hypothetical protein